MALNIVDDVEAREFEADFLAYVILLENPGMKYTDAKRQACKEIREDE